MKQSPKVLIVDKNRVMAEYCQRIIDSEEFEVCGVAGSYEKAVRIAESRPVDVALIDIELNGTRDGIQTAEFLRKEFDIPTLFLTSCMDNKVIQKAMEVKPLGYLIKPMNKENLIPFLKVSLRYFKKGKMRFQDSNTKMKMIGKMLESEKIVRKKLENNLKKQTELLLGAYRALNSMLENREIEKRAIEFHFCETCKKLTLPYIEFLEQEVTEKKSLAVLNMLKRTLEELITPSFNTLFKLYGNLSPQEIQITDMIRNGRTSKEIAGLLNIAPTSISTYRYRIRKKLGILKSGKNLRAYLKSINS